MSGWSPVFALPNLRLESPIEGGFAAIVPPNDFRVVDFAKGHEGFREFARRFSDQFGNGIDPSFLFVSDQSPDRVMTVEALAAFRDMAAVSTIPVGMAATLRYPNVKRVVWGNTFWFHPWSLSRDFKHLVVSTPGSLGMHQVNRFSGQTSPEIFQAPLSRSDFDEPLYQKLLVRWQRLYSTRNSQWSDIALFRSLNMAYQATLMPGTADARYYDLGRLVALWISAFEILAHPGGRHGKADLRAVLNLVEKTPWVSPHSAALRFLSGKKPFRTRRTVASWLYQRMYDVRNDFLHGNPVRETSLLLTGSKRNLFHYAAPIYRLALTSFMLSNHARMRCAPLDDDREPSWLIHPQQTIESALHTARRRLD